VSDEVRLIVLFFEGDWVRVGRCCVAHFFLRWGIYDDFSERSQEFTTRELSSVISRLSLPRLTEVRIVRGRRLIR